MNAQTRYAIFTLLSIHELFLRRSYKIDLHDNIFLLPFPNILHQPELILQDNQTD